VLAKQKKMREHVAKNPSCPIDLLQVLAKDEDWDVRYRVGGNPSAPIETLEEMSLDTSFSGSLPYSVAANPSTPVHILMDLASK
jgi:hypothetical protein